REHGRPARGLLLPRTAHERARAAGVRLLRADRRARRRDPGDRAELPAARDRGGELPLPVRGRARRADRGRRQPVRTRGGAADRDPPHRSGPRAEADRARTGRAGDIAPGCHHVWVSATGGSEYFVDTIDRVAWVRSLVHVLNRLGWTCPAFCQMSTHVHLLVSTPDQSLPLGMRDLNRQYSYEFNIRHDRIGTFLRKRYGSRRIE